MLSLLVLFGGLFGAIFCETQIIEDNNMLTFSIEIKADEAVNTRTGPGTDWSRIGIIYGGIYPLIAGPYLDGSENEWWSIQLDPFDETQIAWIQIDYNIMKTTWVKQPILLKEMQ